LLLGQGPNRDAVPHARHATTSNERRSAPNKPPDVLIAPRYPIIEG